MSLAILPYSRWLKAADMRPCSQARHESHHEGHNALPAQHCVHMNTCSGKVGGIVGELHVTGKAAFDQQSMSHNAIIPQQNAASSQ